MHHKIHSRPQAMNGRSSLLTSPCSHPLGAADSEETEAGGEDAGGEFAKGEAAVADAVFGLEDGAGFEEGVEGAGQFQQIVCQQIGTEVFQDEGQQFPEAGVQAREMDFRFFVECDGRTGGIEGRIELAEDRADADG